MAEAQDVQEPPRLIEVYNGDDLGASFDVQSAVAIFPRRCSCGRRIFSEEMRRKHRCGIPGSYGRLGGPW